MQLRQDARGAEVGTAVTFARLPGLRPLAWSQTLAILACAVISCLVVNDAVKVAMIKWRVPNTVAGKAVDVTAQIAKAEPTPEAKAGLNPMPTPGLSPKPRANPSLPSTCHEHCALSR